MQEKTFKNIILNKFVVFIIVAVGVISVLVSIENDKTKITNTENTVKEKKEISLESKDTVPFSVALLNALNSYYYASTKDISHTDPTLMSIMSILLEQNRNLSFGDDFIKSYLNNENDVIKLSATGMLLGSSQLQKNNSAFLEYLRTANQNDPKFEQEFSYQLAQYGSGQKEGFKNIFIYAPQVGYLYFEGAKSENPTGPIPFRISNSDRKLILNKIDTDFSKSIEQDNENYKVAQTHNAVLLAVQKIKEYLIFDTYEESNVTKK